MIKKNPTVSADCTDLSCADCVYGLKGICEVVELDTKYGDKYDTLSLLPKIPDKSVNLICTDLPYGQTACAWDSIIDLKALWAEYERILTPNGAIVLTCTFKFGVTLVNNAPDMFRYDLVWEKTRATGFLNANRMPMRNHEMILVFYKKLPTFNPQYTQGEAYTRNCDEPKSDIYNDNVPGFQINVVDKNTRNPVSVIKPGKTMNTEIYGNNIPRLIRGYNKPPVEGRRSPVSVIKNENYESGIANTPVHGGVRTRMRREEDGIRSPVSILKHQNGNNTTIHPTQKPLSLWEWLINTYTNPGDMVHDSCLGAGTTLEACQNLNRNCTCFEISDEWEQNYKRILSEGKGMYKLSKIFGREL